MKKTPFILKLVAVLNLALMFPRCEQEKDKESFKQRQEGSTNLDMTNNERIGKAKVHFNNTKHKRPTCVSSSESTEGWLPDGDLTEEASLQSLIKVTYMR